MKNVLDRMHQIAETLQSPQLNIIDAMAIIQSKVELLKKIKDDHDAINAGMTISRKVGNDNLKEEFQRKHQKSTNLIRPNQETTAKITFRQFYQVKFMKVLNMLIEEYAIDCIRCFETLKPFIVVLQPFRTIYKKHFSCLIFVISQQTQN